MQVLFNFLEKYGVEGYNAFLEWFNDPNTSSLEYLAKKFGVTPSRISQWDHEFFEKQRKPKKQIEEALRIWIEVKRESLNRAEESTHHATILRLVDETNNRA